MQKINIFKTAMDNINTGNKNPFKKCDYSVNLEINLFYIYPINCILNI